MLKDILKKLGVDPAEDITDEDALRLINENIEAKDKKIEELESEKSGLSESNQELTTSVEGYKSSVEKLEKDLSETKTKLANTEGKLEQVTGMYKEQFTKDPNQQDTNKEVEALKDDVLQQILDTK